MRSIVSLSLLSLGILNTPFQFIATQPVDTFRPANISSSEYSIVFAQADERDDKLGFASDTLKSSLQKAQATGQAEHDAFVAEQKRLEEERKAEEERKRLEKEARAKEAERQQILAEERAKAEAERLAKIAAQTPAPAPTPAPVITGGKQDWMSAAGIPESDWEFVNYIVQKESSWNPNALNPSSGACGLAQALPCSKISGDWRDPVNALRWQHNYVKARYGSYKGAYDFWIVNSWY